MAADGESQPAVCPVDHQARAAWLEKAQAASSAAAPAPPHPIPPTTAAAAPPSTAPGCDSSQLDQSLPPKPASAGSTLLGYLGLRQDREISSIPRAFPGDQTAAGKPPANNEGDTGADKASGNWIYPSEEMFFNAMKRKKFDPRAEDMRSIVPIHNAVNERAWKEIKEWEQGRGSESCGGPKLVAFSGDSQKLTPRARINSLLGYQAPFDRHDWVIDRCGKTVEYVIDFYSGRDEGKSGKSLNFYLDVRPKLNSWEGVKTRVSRFWGF
ncbi:cytochrome c1 heme lyase [Macrophomina phaseolina]|uniref:Holocytochrome c-type synthase n=1 Tax=Macrophomina phaseolina TaxID=35725 RepID=A0ABQ8FWB7_9PEZI|nr:cytochrome c1 heme lyase [Macrophomina phaseolina]